MAKYVVVGLECSTTKNLSKVIANNLGIAHSDKYDGNIEIEDEYHKVQHFSYPYGQRDHFPEVIEGEWDFVVICTRDFYCSLKSKINYPHQRDKDKANKEHLEGIEKLKNVAKLNNVHFFSYETWYLLQDVYMENFLKEINVE